MHRRVDGGRGSVLVSVLAILVAGIVATAPAAGAAPDADFADNSTSNPSPTTGSTYSLEDFGSSSTIRLYGLNGQYSVALPVPNGMTPTEIHADVTVPQYATRGSIDVLQGDRVLSRTPLSGAARAPVTLPLTGLRPDRQRQSADITLSAHLQTDGFCTATDTDAVVLNNSAVTFAGTDAPPSSVGDFLPAVLRKLTMYVPTDVTRAEGSAAVRLATAVVQRYGDVPVAVETRSVPRTALRPSAPSGQLERQIIVATNAPPGLAVHSDAGGYLTVGGTDDALAAQAALLTSDLSALAITSSAVAGPLRPAPQLAPDVATLSDLGVTDQRSTSATWPKVRIGIDQTRLGRPSKNVRVQLHGSYTPPPASSGGRLSVAVGSKTIAAWPLDASGEFNDWVDIPDDVLARYTELTVTLERGDTRAGCGEGTLSTLSVDASGEVTSEPADPPAPGGFQSVPQALMPRAQLAWTVGDPSDVGRAVSIMTHLQQMSAVPIGVDVVDVGALAASSQPGVLIAADGKGMPAGLDLPVRADGRTVTVTDAGSGPQRITLAPDARFGSLQVARQGSRTVVVATSTGQAQDLDAALRWLDADRERWPGSAGPALIQPPGRDPVFVAAASATAPAAADHTAWYVGIAVGAGLVILAVLAWVLLRGRRRRRPKR